MYNFIRNALEILGSKPWGLKTFCVFIVDVASVGRFPIKTRKILYPRRFDRSTRHNQSRVPCPHYGLGKGPATATTSSEYDVLPVCRRLARLQNSQVIPPQVSFHRGRFNAPRSY